MNMCPFYRHVRGCCKNDTLLARRVDTLPGLLTLSAFRVEIKPACSIAAMDFETDGRVE